GRGRLSGHGQGLRGGGRFEQAVRRGGVGGGGEEPLTGGALRRGGSDGGGDGGVPLGEDALQLVEADRLEQQEVEGGGAVELSEQGLTQAGDGDQHGLFAAFVGAELAGDLDAADARHGDVEQHHFGAVDGGQADGGQAPVGGPDVVSPRPQDACQR